MGVLVEGGWDERIGRVQVVAISVDRMLRGC